MYSTCRMHYYIIVLQGHNHFLLLLFMIHKPRTGRRWVWASALRPELLILLFFNKILVLLFVCFVCELKLMARRRMIGGYTKGRDKLSVNLWDLGALKCGSTVRACASAVAVSRGGKGGSISPRLLLDALEFFPFSFLFYFIFLFYHHHERRVYKNWMVRYCAVYVAVQEPPAIWPFHTEKYDQLRRM